MANETKRYVHGTTTTLEANGAAYTANNAPVAANDVAPLDLGTYTAPADYPHVRFVLSVTMSTGTGIENKVIELIAEAQDIDGTNDAPASTATYRQRVVGTFVLKGIGTIQYLDCDVYDAPRKANYFLFENVGANINSGWTLKATPFTYGPV